MRYFTFFHYELSPQERKKWAFIQNPIYDRLFVMIRLRNENLTATLEAYFLSSQPFDTSYLKSIATKALEQFKDFGLISSQIRQRNGDGLFDYDLSFFLFNYQAQIKVEADRLFVNIRNAKGSGDLDVLMQSLIGAVNCLPEERILRFTFQVAFHGSFDSETLFEEFFLPFADIEKNIASGGRIVFVQEDGWLSPIRALVEKSLAFDNAAYLSCSTEQKGTVDLDQMKMIADKFESAINRLGLKLDFE